MPIKLGELLLKENMVTPQQLQEALDHQKANGGPLDKAFVSLGFLQNCEIVGCLSRQLGLPSINLDYFEVDPAVIKIIPADTARKYQVLPLSLADKTLSLAMADPTNLLAMDDIRFMTGFKVEPVVASEDALEEAIHRYYGPSRVPGTRTEVATTGGAGRRGVWEEPTLTPDDLAALGGLSEIDLDGLDAMYGEEERDKGVDLGNIAKSADASPVIKLANVLFVDSLKRGASDIHIEPYEKEFRVRFRIDGILYNVMALPLKLKDPLLSRIKAMANLKSGEKRFLQEGRIRMRLKVEDRSRDLDFLVRCVPTLWGETIVMRLLDRSRLILDRTRLGLEPQSLERFENAIARPYGLVLFTGPTRSGKTNTLYSAIASLNRPDTDIMTVEDPVEFSLPGVNQVQISESTGASFAEVLRSFERLNPNVIMISEIRDHETAQIAVKLALTGHLVLSTSDTNDAPSTVSRLANLGIDLWPMAVALTLIQAQRLVRRICEDCRVDITAEVPSTALVDIGFKPEEIGSFPLFKGKGCLACYGSGYKLWAGLFEGMEISESICELIKAGSTAAEIKKKALEEGMITLRMSGLEKIKQGITTIEEVFRETVA